MNAVEPLDRYLGAVRSNLPRAHQDDIIDELADNLRSRMEDREAELGRPLTRDEQEAILKAHGHPLVVAARFRGDNASLRFGRQLIGPELFPLYLKVLSVNVGLTIAIGAIVAVFVASGTAIFPAAYGIVVPVVLQFVIVTAIFIAADRGLSRDLALDRWDPSRVKPIDAPEIGHGLDAVAYHLIGKAYPIEVPRATSIFELSLGAIALLWWATLQPIREIAFMAPGPGIATVYLPVLGLMIAMFLQPLVSLVRPGWSRFRVVARAVVDIGFVCLFAVSLASGHWLAPAATANSSDTGVVDLVNSIIGSVLVVTILFTLVDALLEIRRLVRTGQS